MDDGSGQALRRPPYDPVKHVHGGSEARGVAGTGARLSHDLDYRVQGLVAVVTDSRKECVLLLNKENRHRFAKKIDGRTCRLVAIPAAELYNGGVGF